MKKLFNKWKDWCIKGVHFPFAHDPVTGKPSITLLFPYITFVFMLVSLVVLHFHVSVLPATLVTVMVWALSVVFYLLRKMTKAKLNLGKGIVELDGDK